MRRRTVPLLLYFQRTAPSSISSMGLRRILSACDVNLRRVVVRVGARLPAPPSKASAAAAEAAAMAAYHANQAATAGTPRGSTADFSAHEFPTH